MWARVHKGPIVSGQIPTATADSVAALVALPVDTGNARRTRAATALKPAGAAGAGVVGAIMVSASRKDQVTLYPCRVSLMLNRIRHLFAHDDEPYVQPPEITLSPIGLVRNRVKEPMPSGWEKVTSRIIVRPEIEEALLGLEGYSHIIVLFWPHLVPDDERGSKLRLHPLDDPEYALQGILATRSQIRFNPVLVTVVPLLKSKMASESASVWTWEPGGRTSFDLAARVVEPGASAGESAAWLDGVVIDTIPVTEATIVPPF